MQKTKVKPTSQEHEGAPIYWSQTPIYWSPKISFSIFWKGMKRESSDKTMFCVSYEGLTDGLGTFGLPWFMFENKTKNMFLERWGSNIMEPGPQYIGAHQIFSSRNWKPFSWAESTPSQIDWILLNLICVIAKKYLWRMRIFWKKRFDRLKYIRARFHFIGA